MIIKNRRFAVALLSAACSAFAGSASAQSTAPAVSPPAAATAPASTILSVSLPPNARLRLDLDARNEDVLGVVKSFLDGVNGYELDRIMPSASAPGATVPGSGSETKAFPNVEKLGMLKVLSDVDMSTLLQDVHHIRVVAFQMPYRYGVRQSVKEQQAVIRYYEQAYVTREGGRRIAIADLDDTQLLTIGFPGGGFALVMQIQNAGLVVRSDGYPNLDSLGKIVLAAGLQLSASSR